jgi:DNA-dependent protein kinase catalytic subunit
MNVFITEPLIDWEKLARRCAREQGSDGNTAWFPEEKLKIVLKKLSGYNPAHILVEELRTSVHGSKPVIKKLEEIVRGTPHDNVRADFGKKCSVTKQVEALVDLATDPNVLGRMYGGWASWI